MSLDHYVTLGRSGLRVSPFCLGAMTFGKTWAGAPASRSRADHRPLHRARRQLHRHGELLHQGPLREDHRRSRRRHAARRDRLVIATKFSGNLYPGDPTAAARAASRSSPHARIAAPSADRLHRSLLAAQLGRPHADRGDDAALDDLVRAGKVRYLGVSDTPAWKVAEANVTARFRGWSPFIALQIEYSLLERTVEGELVPMAQELGLGITPWSPLRAAC